jgi:hypothetical protein
LTGLSYLHLALIASPVSAEEVIKGDCEMDSNSNRPLRRTEAAEYLKQQHGIVHSPAYLAKLAVTGGGPRFQKARRTPIYTRQYLDEYAASITSPPVRSTSELRCTRDDDMTGGA